MTASAQELFEDPIVKEEVTGSRNDGKKEENGSEAEESEDEKDVFDPDEDVSGLLRKAASSYEYRVKYYEELIHETVSEFERGIKRAHVDELSILINEAADETRQMQNVCHTIMRSLGKLIPIIYQSIEILEYQVKADTEHLCSLEKGDVDNNDETSLQDSSLVASQLNDQQLKERLGQVKLLTSIDKIENRLIKGPVPPKVQNAITKARKLGNSLVQFLEQSKNIRAMFKETQAEVDNTAIINYLAQASARTTESSQNLATYYAKQTVDEVREADVQTSRQVTRLKSELMERTKTNLQLTSKTDKAENEDNEKRKVERVTEIENEEIPNVGDSLKVEERKATAKEAKKDDKKKEKDKGAGAGGKEAKKPAAKGQTGKKAPVKKGKPDPKSKVVQEPTPIVDQDDKIDEKEKEEIEKERLRQSAIDKFSAEVSSQLDSHSKLSRRLAEIHARVRQIKEEIRSADKVFVRFATKDRQNLEDLLYQSMEDVLSKCESVFVKHTACSINLGTLMDALEEGHESKELVDSHQEVKEVVQIAHDEALLSISEIGELVAETEEYYDYFMLVKCIWEVEVPTAIVFDARNKVSNLRDLTYRVQFNRKELMKVSNTLLREVDFHEWSELVEIQVLGAPAKEVERIVAVIDKHTYSNESLVLKALADIDRLNRSSGLQKVEPLEDVQNFLPEMEHRYVQTRTLLNNIHRLMVECKQNVVKLMEDPCKKWNLIRLPFSDRISGPLLNGDLGGGKSDLVIAVIRAPEECMHLLTSQLDVSMKHAWEKNAVCSNELLVSEIVYFPNSPQLPCNILLGLPHGVISVENSSYERLKLKQTSDGVTWTDCESYKDHLFYAYPDHKNLIPSSMVFAELKTDELALAYCVVIEYTDGRDWAKSGPILFTDSKKVFREGGKIAATRDKYSYLIVPKDSFAFLSSVTVKSVKAGDVVENEMKRKFGGLSAMSALYTIYAGASTVSPFTRFTLQIPFPQEVCDVRRPSTARLTVLAFEKNVQQWVLLTNAGRDDDVVSVRGGMCFINVNPNNIQKVMVVNGQCDNVYVIPEELEMLVAKLPRKPYSDDDVLDEHCLRQIVDRLLMEFDRFAIVLGISNQFRNKAKVSRKTNVSQQKFEILKEWRRKNADSGDLVPRMLKALRSEIVSRYDIADWLEEVLRKERQSYQTNREKYQHVQPATHRKDYLFSPATIATDEAPFVLSRVLEEPVMVTSRADSRGLSDISSEKDEGDNIQEEDDVKNQTAEGGDRAAAYVEVQENDALKEDNIQLEKNVKETDLVFVKQKTEIESSKRDINPGHLYRSKTFDFLKK